MDIRILRSAHPTPLPLERGADDSWRASEGDELCVYIRAEEPASAFVSGAPLALESVSRVHGLLETRFRFPIDTWAGRALLLVRAGATERLVSLDVAPHPGKLGIEAFREMLKELSALSKDLPWGFGLGAHAAERDTGSPGVVHPSVLEVELPALMEALRRLRADPLSWTERERALEPLPVSRRVDPSSFRWLVTHPRTLEAIRPSSTEGHTVPAVFVEQPRIHTSLNHPATRYVRYLLERLVRVFTESKKGLEKHRDEPRAVDCARIIDHATGELRNALRAVPLRDVRPEPPGPASLQAIIDHPTYARVQRIAPRLLDPGVRLNDEGALLTSLRPTYDLFELLVLYRLASGFSRALGVSWECTTAAPVPKGVLTSPPEGCVWQARAPQGLTLEMHYQRTFESWSDRPTPFQSLSQQRRPDYVLLLKDREEPLRWVILDAKYRSSRSAIHEGLADIHVYRDALRWNGQPPSAAFIIVPALEPGATRYGVSDYHRTHAFGAIRLDEPEWMQSILGMLDEALSRRATASSALSA